MTDDIVAHARRIAEVALELERVFDHPDSDDIDDAAVRALEARVDAHVAELAPLEAQWPGELAPPLRMLLSCVARRRAGEPQRVGAEYRAMDELVKLLDLPGGREHLAKRAEARAREREQAEEVRTWAAELIEALHGIDVRRLPLMTEGPAASQLRTMTVFLSLMAVQYDDDHPGCRALEEGGAAVGRVCGLRELGPDGIAGAWAALPPVLRNLRDALAEPS